MRKTFVDTLTEMAAANSDIVCVIGDTGFSVFEDFERRFGNRFINIGIAEQNFVAFGAGLAAMGIKPYLYNVVSFMTLRAMEQIVLDVCFQENPVVLVGVGGGHAYGPAGPTHHGAFDLAMLRPIPNLTIVCPADPVEMRACMLASEHYDKPMYIRIGRSIDPVIHTAPIDFRIGKSIRMREGNDASLLATGTKTKDALEVADLLERKGIHISVYSVHTIKPLDEDAVIGCVSGGKPLFTLEEHSVVGGLGSAVGEVLHKIRGESPIRFKPYGFPDMFAPVTGSREYLGRLFGIDPLSIAADMEQAITSR